jgi:type I restriction enzyme, R subunit
MSASGRTSGRQTSSSSIRSRPRPCDREDIQQAAQVNTLDDFRLVFEKELEGLFVDRMEGNDDIFRRVMQDEQFRAMASAYLMSKVYAKARERVA